MMSRGALSVNGSRQGRGGHRCEHMQFHFYVMVLNVEGNDTEEENVEKVNIYCNSGCLRSSSYCFPAEEYLDAESEPGMMGSWCE